MICSGEIIVGTAEENTTAQCPLREKCQNYLEHWERPHQKALGRSVDDDYCFREIPKTWVSDAVKRNDDQLKRFFVGR